MCFRANSAGVAQRPIWSGVPLEDAGSTRDLIDKTGAVAENSAAVVALAEVCVVRALDYHCAALCARRIGRRGASPHHSFAFLNCLTNAQKFSAQIRVPLEFIFTNLEKPLQAGVFLNGSSLKIALYFSRMVHSHSNEQTWRQK